MFGLGVNRLGVNRTGRQLFDPVRLFLSDEEGTFLDFTTSQVYADTAGTDPAEVGEGIALTLDKSQGGELGPELVTNGDFSDGTTGWTLQGTASIADGVGVINSSSSLDRIITASQILPAGKTVRVEFDVVVISGGVQVQDTIGGGTTAFTTSGRKVLHMLDASNRGLQFFRSAASGSFNGTIDNISVRELKGVHALQATSTARPIFARVPVGGRRNLLERTEEFDNEYWVKTRATITANATTAPDGTLTADKLNEDATDATSHVVNRNVTLTAASATFSVYLKAAERNFASIVLASGGSHNIIVAVNLTTGELSPIRDVFSSWTEEDAAAESVGDGWWRVSLSGSRAFTLIVPIICTADSLTTATGGSIVTTAAPGEGIYIWGAQLEVAS